MKTKTILMSLAWVACSAAWLWADTDENEKFGGFYGIITFHDCSCLNPEERVRIQPTSGGIAYLYGVDCGNPQYGDPAGYTTEGGTPQTLPPGDYYIGVVLHQGSDCDHSVVQMVNHGYGWHEVNLDVYGPDGGGSSPPPGP